MAQPTERAAAPPSDVLAAWAVDTAAPPSRGQGSAFVSGDLVFKPVVDAREAAWIAGVLEEQPARPDLRVIRPVRTVEGQWTIGDWVAFEHVEGSKRAGDWQSALDVSDRFHELVSAVQWSPALQREHPWAIGDAFAWGERDLAIPSEIRQVFERLQAGCESIEEPSQLVHGDLCNNILFHDTLPPAVIDISPFWRPKRYADAIAVIDAVGWFHATGHALEPLSDHIGRQLVIRATLFRLGSALVLVNGDHDRMAGEIAAYEHILDVLDL